MVELLFSGGKEPPLAGAQGNCKNAFSRFAMKRLGLPPKKRESFSDEAIEAATRRRRERREWRGGAVAGAVLPDGAAGR